MKFKLFPELGSPHDVEAPTPIEALLQYPAVRGEECVVKASGFMGSFIFLGFRWAEQGAVTTPVMKDARESFVKRTRADSTL